MLVLSCGLVSVCSCARCHCFCSKLVYSVFWISAYSVDGYLYLPVSVITPVSAKSKTWRGSWMCCFAFQVQSFCSMLSLLTKHIKCRRIKAEEVWNILFHVNTTIYMLQFAICFWNLQPRISKITRNFCSCSCMSHLPSHNLHPEHHWHTLIWRRL